MLSKNGVQPMQPIYNSTIQIRRCLCTIKKLLLEHRRSSYMLVGDETSRFGCINGGCAWFLGVTIINFTNYNIWGMNRTVSGLECRSVRTASFDLSR